MAEIAALHYLVLGGGWLFALNILFPSDSMSTLRGGRRYGTVSAGGSLRSLFKHRSARAEGPRAVALAWVSCLAWFQISAAVSSVVCLSSVMMTRNLTLDSKGEGEGNKFRTAPPPYTPLSSSKIKMLFIFESEIVVKEGSSIYCTARQ